MQPEESREEQGIQGKFIAFRDMIIQKIKAIDTRWTFGTGLFLLVVLLTLTFLIPCPTAAQFLFFRIVLSMALAIVSLGFFKLSYSGVLKIGSGFAVFMVSYFANPAIIVIQDDCFNRRSFTGKVFFEKIPLSGVQIDVPFLNESDISNASGEFDISYSGLADTPLDIHLRYRSIDTVFRLGKLPENRRLTIHLKDTISALTPENITTLIQDYLDRFQAETEAEHQRYMYRHPGSSKITLEELNRRYTVYEGLKCPYRNPTEFSNRFIKLKTQKSIRATGIIIDPMHPYQAYHLREYEIYLYRSLSGEESGEITLTMDFAFINLLPAGFKITNIRRTSATEYQVQTEHANNIRYVRTSLYCTAGQNRVKYQSTFYKGSRPVETYIIRFISGRWQLFDTKS